MGDSRVKNAIAAHFSYARPFALLTIRLDVPSSSTSRSEQESAPGPIAHWASGDEDLVSGGQDRRLLKSLDHFVYAMARGASSALFLVLPARVTQYPSFSEGLDALSMRSDARCTTGPNCETSANGSRRRLFPAWALMGCVLSGGCAILSVGPAHQP
ncbi:hypothetical protein B0H13DRAFT_2673036 [Mycena leptocephala]|nr:hypothetical protein B0H13DRAFT_2673036 [Mycena leptocephala]